MNNLNYREEIDNIVEERTLKSNYSQAGLSATYKENDTIVFNLNTSYDFIDPSQSYLTFGIRVFSDVSPTTDQATYLYGSILNIIRRSVTFTRYGNEVDRLDDLNLLNYYNMILEPPDTLTNEYEALMMASEDARGNAYSSNYFSFTIVQGGFSSGYIYVAIPLRYISSVFNSDMLIPPQLSNGLKIELSLEEYKKSFVQHITAGKVIFTGYELKDVQLRLDSYKISEEKFKKITGMDKIKYNFMSWYTHKHEAEQNNQLSGYSIDIRRPASLAQKALMIRRDNSFNEDITANWLASTPFLENTESIWRVGELAFPRDILKGRMDHYMNLVYCRESNTKLGIDKQQFIGSNTTDAENLISNYGSGSFNVNFKRNKNKSSGLTLNSEHQLIFDIKTTVPSPETWLFFIQHLRELVIEKDKINLFV